MQLNCQQRQKLKLKHDVPLRNELVMIHFFYSNSKNLKQLTETFLSNTMIIVSFIKSIFDINEKFEKNRLCR